MKHISLFSGIGGFDLAAEWMGWENVAHCEWNPFGQKILKYYWPNSISYEDITKTNFSIHRGSIDIVTGGFPCQPYSVAGKRKGNEDERHLWPEMLRAIREIQPNWVVGENVRGLINWNGGMVFNQVQSDLEAEGYEVFPFLLPASSVNAPHRRERIWFIAYATSSSKRSSRESSKVKSYWSENDNKSKGWRTKAKLHFGCSSILQYSKVITYSKSFRRDQRLREEIINRKWKDNKQKFKGENLRDWDSSISGTGISSDTNGFRLWRKSNRARESGFFNEKSSSNDWENFPTQSPICDGNDGIPSKLDGITISKWAKESIKAGGNAIVPQVVYQIFKAIEEYELLNHVS